jgi:hypothetical protein
MQVTLIFATTTAFLSRVIRWFTRSKASHALLGAEMDGVAVILEATTGGVRIFPRKRWERSHVVVGEYLFKPDMSGGLRHAIEHVGDKYDYLGLVGFMFVVVARWLGRKIKNPLASPSREVCSEFVLQVDPQRVKIPEWQGLDPETTDPEDLWRLCRLGQSFAPVAGAAPGLLHS